MKKLKLRNKDLRNALIILVMFALGISSMSAALAKDQTLEIAGIQIRITDSATGEPLADAVLSIHRRGFDDKYTLRTDSAGNCETGPLKAGSTYDIIETEAPEGYIIPMRGWSIIVAEDGATSAKGKDLSIAEDNGVYYLNIKNVLTGEEQPPVYDDSEIPLGGVFSVRSSGQTNNTFLMAVGICMMLVACLWMISLLVEKDRKRRHFQSEETRI